MRSHRVDGPARFLEQDTQSFRRCARRLLFTQVRPLAARRRGDLLQLPCCMFSYSGPEEEEARMFITANRAETK